MLYIPETNKNINNSTLILQIADEIVVTLAKESNVQDQIEELELSAINLSIFF